MEDEQEQGPEPDMKKAKAPDPRQPVRLVSHRGGSALVEWIDENGRYRRAYVPLEKLRDGTVASRDLAKGIPYGLPWEKWITITASPERIANELRRAGMWEWKDVSNAALDGANKAFDKGEFLRRVAQEVDR